MHSATGRRHRIQPTRNQKTGHSRGAKAGFISRSSKITRVAILIESSVSRREKAPLGLPCSISPSVGGTVDAICAHANIIASNSISIATVDGTVAFAGRVAAAIPASAVCSCHPSHGSVGRIHFRSDRYRPCVALLPICMLRQRSCALMHNWCLVLRGAAGRYVRGMLR